MEADIQIATRPAYSLHQRKAAQSPSRHLLRFQRTDEMRNERTESAKKAAEFGLSSGTPPPQRSCTKPAAHAAFRLASWAHDGRSDKSVFG